jgi:membrane-associated phospholipid phosphatase
MDLKRDHAPVLRLFAFYLAAVAGVCAAGLAVRPVPCALLAAGHAAAAALLAARAGRGSSPLLPWLLWLGCWLELGWIIRWTGRALHDPAVAALDLAVFGAHGHLMLPDRLPGLTTPMHAAYLSYYALVLGPALLLARRRAWPRLSRYTFTVMATYLACFTVYLVWPVLGPRAAGAAAAGTAGGLAGLEAALRALGDSPGTAFPSSHCAGAWAAALAATTAAAPPVRAALIAWAALITVSTVHTGNHYGLDAVAGVAVALLIRLIATESGLRKLRPAATASAAGNEVTS